MKRLPLLLAVLPWALGAAANELPPDLPEPTHAWMPAGVDFKQAETLTITFDDYSYDPDEVVLKKGRPYKITFDNKGGLPHDFVNAPFFHAVVFQKIVTESGTVNTPHVHSLYLQTGKKMLLYLVPIQAGSYDVYCSIEGHRAEGMEGVFKIVE